MQHSILNLCPFVGSFEMEVPDKVVHQHITNQSLIVWTAIPDEITDHGINSIFSTLIDTGYDPGNDIITGSAEEDVTTFFGPYPFRFHFWNPDDPQDGDYNHGLDPNSVSDFGCIGICDSSYTKAKNYWQNEVLPLYIGKTKEGTIHKIDQDESYYWLGRTAHFLEDAAQPSHVQLDPHADHKDFLIRSEDSKEYFDDSILEKYTAENFREYSSSNLNIIGDEYQYENLIPSWNENDWIQINPNVWDEEYPSNLFKLFWYTAQKTQYFASDDSDGNEVYRKSGSDTIHILPNLWSGEPYSIINSKTYFFNGDLDDNTNEDFYYSTFDTGRNCEAIVDPICSEALGSSTFSCWYCSPNNAVFLSGNIDLESEAMFSHAMRAVAGLYRLFWNTVREELRLHVPVNPSSPLEKDEVEGAVKSGGTWQTELSVDSSNINSIDVKYIALSSNGCNADISMLLKSPSGAPYSGSLQNCRIVVSVSDPDPGIWNINVTADSLPTSSQRFKISAQALPNPPEQPADSVGGINFSDTKIDYISTCDPEEGLQVVMGGEEQNVSAGEPLIDITTATVQATDAFLTGLVIPDSKMWITMDTKPGAGFAGRVGDVSRDRKSTRLN